MSEKKMSGSEGFDSARRTGRSFAQATPLNGGIQGRGEGSEL